MVPADLVPATVTTPDGQVYEKARVIHDERRVVVFIDGPDKPVRILDGLVLSVPVALNPFAPLRRQRIEIITGTGRLTAVRSRSCNCGLRTLRRINAARVLMEH